MISMLQEPSIVRELAPLMSLDPNTTISLVNLEGVDGMLVNNLDQDGGADEHDDDEDGDFWLVTLSGTLAGYILLILHLHGPFQDGSKVSQVTVSKSLLL